MSNEEQPRDSRGEFPHSHDRFFKHIFSRKEAVGEFIEKLLPALVSQHIDVTSLKLEQTEYVDEELKRHFSDLVYDAKYTNDDNEIDVKVSLLFEHKSVPDKYPHFQIMRYMMNIWTTQAKQKQALTPVIPIVFYHGTKAWKQQRIEDYFPNLDEILQHFVPSFDYVLFDTSAHNSDELSKLTNAELHMGIMMMKYIFSSQGILEKVNEIFAELDKIFQTQEGKKYFNTTLIYLFNNTKLTLQDLEENMDTATLAYREEFVSTAARWREEGREEGREETAEQITLSMLEEGFPDDAILKLTKITATQLDKLKRKYQQQK